jgi:thiaminase
VRPCEYHGRSLTRARYVLDIGQSEDSFALNIALLPCLVGYGMIGRRLYDAPDTVKGGKYYKWIQTYVDKHYTDAVDLGRSMSSRSLFGYYR